LGSAKHAFELTTYRDDIPQDLTFQKAVTVTIHYSDTDIAVISNEN
jgi:hypothetical protein